MMRAIARAAHWVGNVSRESVLGVCLGVTLSCLTPAYVLAGDFQREMSFDIAPQSLASAVLLFADQSKIQVVTSSGELEKYQTKGLEGRYTVQEALTALLNGTGLSFQEVGSGTVSIDRAAAPSSGLISPPSTATSSEPNRLARAVQGGTVSSAAADEQSDTAPSPPGNESPQLEEVVVTAQKREERLQNVPISVSVLTGSELDKSTAQGVSEALNAVPGVATSENYLGGGTSVVIRGVQAAGPLFTGSSAVAYYLDSVPFGLIRSAIAPDQSAYDLSRVEVLRGPQGTLYGASALNGVVRVLSNDPDLDGFDIKGRVSGSDTEYGGGNYRGDVAVNVPLIDGILAARAVIGYEHDSGWIDQTNKSNVNDAELRNYRLKIKAQATSDLSVVLSAWSSHDNYGAPSIGYAFDKSSSLLDQPIKTDFDAYGMTVNDELPWFSISSMTSYLDYRNNADLDLLPFGFPGYTFFSGLWSNVFSQEINLTSPKLGEWRWSVGGIYIRATENNLQTYTDGPQTLVAPETVLMVSRSLAGYGELTRYLLDDRLEITAGIRHYHDDVSQLGQLTPGTPFTPAGGTFDANTPRAVATWHQNDHVMLYASYSQGFRSGFPQDPSVAASIPAGYPPVAPDRLRNYEVGSKGDVFGGMFSYDSSVYYMKWDGIQQQLYIPYGGVQDAAIAVVNAQSASGVGADLAVALRPMKGLTLKADGSWNNLEMDADVQSGGVALFKKGDRPNYSPEITAGLSADYEHALGGSQYTADFSASVNYTSSQSFRALVGSSPLIQSGDPMTIGRVSYSIAAPSHWTATLYVNNVTNDRGSPINDFAGVPDWAARIRPRTFGVQFESHLR